MPSQKGRFKVKISFFKKIFKHYLPIFPEKIVRGQVSNNVKTKRCLFTL